MRRVRLVLISVLVLLIAVTVAAYAALTSLDIESYRGTIEQRAERATGRPLRLTGPMSLKVDFTPAIAAEGVRFANAEWGSEDQMATVKRFEMEIALLPLLVGEIEVRRLVLVEPRILLETNEKGLGNWVFFPETSDDGDGEEPVGADEEIPTVRSVSIEDGRLTYRDGKTGEDLRLVLQRATLRPGDGEQLRVDADGSYQDAQFGLSGTVGSLAKLVRGGSRTPADLTLTTGNTTIRMTGALDQTTPDLRPDLEVTATGEDFADLEPLVGDDLPDVGPFDLKARVRGEAKGYVLTGIQAKLGNSDLAGEATLRVTGARPMLSGEFTTARVDLPELLGRLEDGPDADSAPELFPDKPLPLKTLRRFDADLKVNAGALRLTDGVVASEVELALDLADGHLKVKPLRGQLAGGSLGLDLDMDARADPPTVALDLSADRIDYGRLLQDTQISKRISGTFGGHAELRGSGGTPRAIAASLGGNLEITGNEGRVDDALLDAISANLGDLFALWAQDEEGMRLNCVVARFKVADGVASSRAILADTKDVTVVGDGSIDLRQEVYDLHLVPNAKQTNLASLVVPIQITGPLTDPDVGPDPLGAARAGAIAIGTLINPLVTLGALIADSELSDQNPCVEALRKANNQNASGKTGEPAKDSDEGGLGGFLEELGKSIDKQLGTEGNAPENDPSVLQEDNVPKR